MSDGKPRFTNDGHVPLNKGYTPAPSKVQGGYQPTTSQHGKPPHGGSAVQPAKK